MNPTTEHAIVQALREKKLRSECAPGHPLAHAQLNARTVAAKLRDHAR